jgi:hypothetical protein
LQFPRSQGKRKANNVTCIFCEWHFNTVLYLNLAQGKPNYGVGEGVVVLPKEPVQIQLLTMFLVFLQMALRKCK